MYIEVDQDAIIQLNGETSESNRLTPDQNGDSSVPAYFHKYGDTWSCVVTNKSVNQLNDPRWRCLLSPVRFQRVYF